MKKAKQNLSVQKLVACKSVLCAQVSVCNSIAVQRHLCKM